MFMQNLKILKPDYMNQELEFEYLVKNIKKKIIVNYDNIQFIRLAVKF